MPNVSDCYTKVKQFIGSDKNEHTALYTTKKNNNNVGMNTTLYKHNTVFLTPHTHTHTHTHTRTHARTHAHTHARTPRGRKECNGDERW